MNTRILWASFSTGLDEHPSDEKWCEQSKHPPFDECEWCGEWEPFACAPSGKWWAREGGNLSSLVVWKRPFRPIGDK